MTIEANGEISIDGYIFECYTYTEPSWNGRVVNETSDEEALVIKAFVLLYFEALSKGPQAVRLLEREIYNLFDDDTPDLDPIDPEIIEAINNIQGIELDPRFAEIENRIKLLLYHPNFKDAHKSLEMHKSFVHKAAKAVRQAGRKAKKFIQEHKTEIVVIAAVVAVVATVVLTAGAAAPAAVAGAGAAAAEASSSSKQEKNEPNTPPSQIAHDSAPSSETTTTDVTISSEDINRALQNFTPTMGVIPLPGVGVVGEVANVAQVIVDAAALAIAGSQIYEHLENTPVDAVDSEIKKRPSDVYAPDRPLPRDEHGIPIPDTDAPHTQLGTRESKRTGELYPQAREFDKDGNPVRDVDFTDHNKPDKHPNPHQHRHIDNETGGTPERSKNPEPVPEWSYE